MNFAQEKLVLDAEELKEIAFAIEQA
jgi:hypothetical protein